MSCIQFLPAGEVERQADQGSGASTHAFAHNLFCFAERTFHHFADYNWDPQSGCPSFVSEAPGDGLKQVPDALNDTHRYVINIAKWLSAALHDGSQRASALQEDVG